MFFDQFILFAWKEYRNQRWLWAGCLLIGVFVLSTTHVFWQQPATGGPPLIPVLYAMACGAMLFAHERETRSSNWLVSMSAKPAPLLCAKLGFGIVAIYALQVCLAICEIGLQEAYLEYSALRERHYLFIPFALVQFIWSVFGSLLSRKTLFSIGAAVFWQCVLIFVPMAIIASVFRHNQEPHEYVFWTAYCSVNVIVAVADIWLGWRWCRGRYLDGSVLEEIQSRLTQLTGERHVSLVSWKRLPNRPEYDREWKRSWQRLVWQERHRESLHLALLAIGCIIGPMMFATDYFVIGLGPEEVGLKILVMFGCLCTPCMIGVLAFETDPDQQQLRFLNGRGVSPFGLWLAKQVVWLPRAFVITLTIAAVCWVSNYQMAVLTSLGENWRRSMLAHWPPFESLLILEYILIAYSCGQFASVVFKRSIMAMIAGLALDFTVTMWLMMMTFANRPIADARFLEVAFVGFVIASAMMAFSVLQIRVRMSEQPVWRQRLQFLTASIGLLFGAAMTLNFIAG